MRLHSPISHPTKESQTIPIYYFALCGAAGVINTTTAQRKGMKILEIGNMQTNISNGTKCPYSIYFFNIYIIILTLQIPEIIGKETIVWHI